MTAAGAWRVVSSRPVLAAAVIGVLLLLTGEYRRHREDVKITVAPVTAQSAARAESWERAPLSPSCPEVTVLRPAPRAVAKLEREFGLELGRAPGSQDAPRGPISGAATNGSPQDSIEAGATAGASAGRQILGLKTLPKLPRGGEGLITLPPGGGEVELTIKANSPPFFELLSEWGAGGLAGVDQDGQRWRGYVFVVPARVGRIHLRGEAGAEGRGGESGPFVMVGAEIRF